MPEVIRRGISVDDLCDDDDYDLNEAENTQLIVPASAPQARSFVGHADGGAFEEMKKHNGSYDQNTSFNRRNQMKWIWGVTCQQHAAIGATKLRISIQDVHLLFQIVAFSSDLITSESVCKLKEIHDDIEEREQFKRH